MQTGSSTRLFVAVCAALVGVSLIALPGVSVRVATSKRFARVTVYVPQRPEHRALIVSGMVLNEEGEPIWDRVSGVELDGENARKQHVIEWHPNPGALHVRAEAIGVCGSGEAIAFVGW